MCARSIRARPQPCRSMVRAREATSSWSMARVTCRETQIAYSPPQTVVEEFKVQTATFDASFGFMPGAAMNMTLKSGANALHGEGNYLMQNPVLNADNYFRVPGGKPQMRIHRTSA